MAARRTPRARTTYRIAADAPDCSGGTRTRDPRRMKPLLWPLSYGAVGMAGFEPAASPSRTERAARLRHIPNRVVNLGTGFRGDPPHHVRGTRTPAPDRSQGRPHTRKSAALPHELYPRRALRSRCDVWGQQDSNPHQPITCRGTESVPIMKPPREESNLRPPGPEPGALSTAPRGESRLLYR